MHFSPFSIYPSFRFKDSDRGIWGSMQHTNAYACHCVRGYYFGYTRWLFRCLRFFFQVLYFLESFWLFGWIFCREESSKSSPFFKTRTSFLLNQKYVTVWVQGKVICFTKTTNTMVSIEAAPGKHRFGVAKKHKLLFQLFNFLCDSIWMNRLWNACKRSLTMTFIVEEIRTNRKWNSTLKRPKKSNPLQLLVINLKKWKNPFILKERRHRFLVTTE